MSKKIELILNPDVEDPDLLMEYGFEKTVEDDGNYVCYSRSLSNIGCVLITRDCSVWPESFEVKCRNFQTGKDEKGMAQCLYIMDLLEANIVIRKTNYKK